MPEPRTPRRCIPLWLAMLCALLASCGVSAPRTVVIIGGPHSEGPGKHEYQLGVARIARMIDASPEARTALKVKTYPDGWPVDPHALDDAATVIWYFDGMDHHPMTNPGKRATMEAARQRGVGIIALHQASTSPASDSLGLEHWLGGVRLGMADRTTEWAALEPAIEGHPVAHGLREMALRDEFYPTFRFADTGQRTPILVAELHPQFRNGDAVLDDHGERVDVAWTYETNDGARSFVFTGAHFIETLDRPDVARLITNAALWTSHLPVPDQAVDLPTPLDAAPPATLARVERATFHADSRRSGWYAEQDALAPDDLRQAAFGIAWESPPLDAVDGHDARLYASPLFIDALTLKSGPLRGETFAVVIAASSNGYVYAINARRHGDLAPGRILWRTRLDAPCYLKPAPLDGVPTGILSTPVADVRRGRLYVTHCAAQQGWQAYALELATGQLIDGWPVRLDEPTLNRVNANAGPTLLPPTRKFDFRVQRGALNLSPEGDALYVVFGETETGWIAAIDTKRPHVSSAFAAVAMPHRGSGGIWGAGGPAVDEAGHVFVVTGSGFDGYRDLDHDWTQSVLKLAPPSGVQGFVLQGTYTPFNYCLTAKMDIDLGSGGAALLKGGATPLMVVGGKQGNMYLLDPGHLPGRLDRRPACTTNSASDGSLLPPGPQPQFGKRGPLNVFGPYSEEDASMDVARARSVPATFRDKAGVEYVYATGNNKAARGSAASVPPSLVRLRVERPSHGTPFLRVDARASTLVMGNPGSPVVTSGVDGHPVVWVLDENAPRSASLNGSDAPRPILYAVDGLSMEVLWKSLPGELFTSGKYNEPTFGQGQVMVGTDRIQAFGAGGKRMGGRAVVAPVQPAPAVTNIPAVPADTNAKDIFQQRCAMCHEHPQGNIPPRAVLKTRSHERIVDALSKGVMRQQAAGLSARQIEEIAVFLKE